MQRGPPAQCGLALHNTSSTEILPLSYHVYCGTDKKKEPTGPAWPLAGGREKGFDALNYRRLKSYELLPRWG